MNSAGRVTWKQTRALILRPGRWTKLLTRSRWPLDCPAVVSPPRRFEMKRFAVAAFAAALLLTPSIAKDKGKDKAAKAAQVVDSGSFGIFVNGQSVATEKFQIEQRA